MMRSLLLAALLVVLAGGAGKEDATTKDLEKMQGNWAQVSMVVDGEKLGEDEAQALFRTIKGQEYTVARYKKTIGKGSFTLDAGKKPKNIDARPAIAGQNITMLGIYEFEGEKLKLCFARAGRPRPTEFAARKDSGHTFSVWEREKK
ncbi:MAG TPA: TIGR03067 domain-containing protein [Bryobacteraceae bacterium]|nr:TIGR03067 domain-containing protein [Bryobacteraceae bacterium]